MTSAVPAPSGPPLAPLVPPSGAELAFGAAWRLALVLGAVAVLALAAHALAAFRRRHPARFARAAWLTGGAAIALLALGDLRSGGWRARGFAWPLYLCGVGVIGGLGFAARPRVARRIGAWAARISAAFAQAAPAPAPAHRGFLAAGTALTGAAVAAWAWTLAASPPFLFGGEVVMARELGAFLGGGRLCAVDEGFNLFSVLVALFARSPDAAHVGALGRIAAALLTAATAMWIVQRAGARWGAAAAMSGAAGFVLVVTADPHACGAREDVLFMLLCAVSLDAMVRCAQPEAPARRHLAAGLLVGLATSAKQSGVVLVAAYALAAAGGTAERRALLARLCRFCAGLAIALFPLALAVSGCGRLVADMPFFAAALLRGHEVLARGTQAVNAEIVAGRLAPALLLDRASLQTVGELALGGAATLIVPLATYFPVQRFALDRPSRRTLGCLLAVAFAFWGFGFWRKGDSSNPMFLLLPFGLVAWLPCLRAALRVARGATDRGARLVGATLLATNLVLAAGAGAHAAGVARDAARRFRGFRAIDARAYRLGPDERALREDLVRSGLPIGHREPDFRALAFALSGGAVRSFAVAGDLLAAGDAPARARVLRELAAAIAPETRTLLLARPERTWMRRRGARPLAALEPCARLRRRIPDPDPGREIVLLEVDLFCATTGAGGAGRAP